MRKILAPVVAVVLAIAFVASFASAQPGIGIVKTPPLSGTGSSGSPMKIDLCASGELLKSNGAAWACSADSTGIAQVNTQAPLTGGPITSVGTVSLAPCALNEIYKWDGASWACAADGGGGEVVQAVSTIGTINDLSLNSTTTVLKFTGVGSVTLTGITGGTDGRVLKIDNSTASVISFSHDVTSTAANRFFLVGSTSHILQDNASVLAVYSGTDSRWHIASGIEGVTAGTGLSGGGTAANPTLTVNVAGASCSAGSFVSAIGATGTGTCTGETGDISGVTANSPLSGGGASGAVTVGMANGDRGDITLTTGVQTGDTWTIDPSTVTSAKLNITTTSCSAGQAVTAISAGGVGTCTAVGVSGGTTNYLARWTSSTALGIGQVFDDNTNEVKVGGGADAATRADAEMIVTLNGDTSISVRNSTNDTEFVAVAGGSTVSFGSQTNTNVSLIAAGTAFATYTGSGFSILDNTAVTGTFSASGTATFNGDVTLGNAVIGDTTTVISQFNTTGGTTLGDSSADVTQSTGLFRTAAVFADVGTLPTISTCASGTRTGGQWSFTVTPGSTTACTATFATACSATPTCSLTPGFNTTAIHYISAVSTTAVTFNITGTGWSGSQPVHVLCICH